MKTMALYLVFLLVLVCSLSPFATAQMEDEDWIDPYDMLNYEPSTKTMRKPPETANYPNVPTKRREHTQDSPTEQTACNTEVKNLKRQIEELQKKLSAVSQQPTCSPVFKRFLSKLLKEVQRVGVPSDSVEVFYDAKVKLSRQAMIEIQTLLESEDALRTGALDNALSQILIDLRPHDYEAWKWRFEDTFGVELDHVLKIGLSVLVIVAIICTQLWSTVSWFVQFKRIFAVSFFISIVWNWFYLYKIAFAEHQSNIVKMDTFNEKCTGVKKLDWRDNLREWYRSTWTLQDDPCKKYYEVLSINPLLLVPPTKAISVTITTFITEPLKHFGQGISEFLRALLKDLPVTLQIPVLLTIVLAILVFMYGSVHAAFQHGVLAPFRRSGREPPPPQLEQPQRHVQALEDVDPQAGGDTPQRPQRPRVSDSRLNRDQVRQRRPNRPREEPAKVFVETLRSSPPPYSEDETDAQRGETDQDPSAESDPENQQEELEGATGGSVAADTDKQTKPDASESDLSQSKPQKVSKKPQDESRRDIAAGRRSPQTDVQDLGASAEEIFSSARVSLEEKAQ